MVQAAIHYRAAITSVAGPSSLNDTNSTPQTTTAPPIAHNRAAG